MPIEPIRLPVSLGAAALVKAADATPAATSAVKTTAAAPALGPNPRIEFDPKLRLVVLEYHDTGSEQPSYYPEAASTDFSGGEYDLSA